MRASLWGYYDTHKRDTLAWRETVTPYRVVVSEIMLQQTRVGRVEDYFQTWMDTFPDWNSLAQAPLREVLIVWQGLGYNRRGKYLHDIAQIVDQQFGGTLPRDRQALQVLPGIGPYTCGAIRAFAFDEMDLFLETNIRTVLVYHFYSHATPNKMDEKELLDVLERYIATDSRARNSPREFYYALMDYGAHLKKEVGNLNKHSRAYTKQSRFAGSRRELRAQLLRYVLHHGPVSSEQIVAQSNRDPDLVTELAQELVKEGSVQVQNNEYFVA